MLVKFAIDPQSLMGDADTIINQMEALLNRWEFFGILLNFDEVEDTLATDRYSINLNVRDAWDTALRANEPSMAYAPEIYRTGHPDDSLDAGLWDVLSKQLDVQSIARKLAARRSEIDIDLAVLEKDTADVMGVLNRNAPLNLIDACGGVEPTGLASAHRSTKFQDAKRLSAEPIGKDTKRDMIWESRFQGLAAYSSEIVIIDKYAVRSHNIAGVRAFIKHLDRDSVSCHLTIFSSLARQRQNETNKADQEVKRIRKYLLDSPPVRGIKKITVHLLPDEEHPHDRYIRFNRNVFSTGRGITDAFKESVVSEEISCTLQDAPKSSYSAQAKRERDLERKSTCYSPTKGNNKWLCQEEPCIIIP